MATFAGQATSGARVLSRASRFDRGKVGRLTLLWILNLFFLFFFLFPFYWQTITSLKPASELYVTPVVWFPSHLDFSHFHDVFTQQDFARNILNSVIVASATTFAALLFGTLSAYALAR